MPDLIIKRNKDVCLLCGVDIYEAKLQIIVEGKVAIIAGYECACGRWVKDKDGHRLAVQRIDPEHENTVRELAEYLRRKKADEPTTAMDVLMQKMLEDGDVEEDIE